MHCEAHFHMPVFIARPIKISQLSHIKRRRGFKGKKLDIRVRVLQHFGHS